MATYERKGSNSVTVPDGSPEDRRLARLKAWTRVDDPAPEPAPGDDEHHDHVVFDVTGDPALD